MKTLIRSALILSLLLAGCGGGNADPNATTDLDLARQTLIDFFEAVEEGDYAGAVALHAENEDFYQFNRENNPDVDPNNRAALLEAACARQLVCLGVQSIISQEQVKNDEFLFVVEFGYPNGTTYVMGPCCGEDETSMPPTSEFEYRVEKTDEGFFVIGGPLYVP